MGRRKNPESAKGPKSQYNPLNFAAPTRTAIIAMREAANLSQAESARAIGFERRRANITWYRFEAATTKAQRATPTRFAYMALYNILVRDDDPRNWRGGMPGELVPHLPFQRKSTKTPVELARAVPDKYRRACAHNPLDYVPPTPNQIRNARLQAKLSLTEASNTIGLSKRAWQNFEYGAVIVNKKNVRKAMPFNNWALFNILALHDNPANWRAGLPSKKTPYVHTGYASRPMRDSKEAVEYTLRLTRRWRRNQKMASAQKKPASRETGQAA